MLTDVIVSISRKIKFVLAYLLKFPTPLVGGEMTPKSYRDQRMNGPHTRRFSFEGRIRQAGRQKWVVFQNGSFDRRIFWRERKG